MKSVWLYINGDNDYSALEFEQNFDAVAVCKEMLQSGETRRTIELEDGDEIHLKILEFGPVDDKLVEFIKNEICDYDDLKHKNIIRLK